jgi:endo-1,4-beta-xylanase
MKRIFTILLISISFLELSSGQTPIAAGKSKFLGCIYSTGQTTDFANYFNQVTPENAGKWGSVETSDGTYNFATLDVARAFAKTNGFPFRFHVLVWGNQQPTWLKSYSDPQKVIKIKAWFQKVASYYDGTTDAKAVLEYIEVVNEVLNDPPDNLGTNATDATSGDYVNALKSLNTELNTTAGTYDWVINAFKLARQYFPSTTKLVLNEYGVENDESKMASYITLINLLKAENLVDIVGMQAHAFSTKMYGSDNTALLTTTLNTLAATGLPIQITEMDIDGNTGANQATKDANQKTEYQRVFNLYWNHPSVMGITLWGFRTGMWRTANEAYLINPNTNLPRSALSEYLNTTIRASNPATSSPIISESAGEIKIYPNPSVNGLFTIEFNENDAANHSFLEIIDLHGRVIFKNKVTANKINMGQPIPQGVYFVKITNKKGSSVRKLMVQH